MPENKRQSGMTLVEILVALVMFGIIATGAYNVFRVHNLMAAKQEETTLMEQELLSSMVQIAEDLRMCGYSPNGGNFGFNATGSDGKATNNTSIYCTRDTFNSNGILDNDENATEYVAYKRIGTSLSRFVLYTNGTRWEPVATNIGNINFQYFDANGNIVADPSTDTGLIRTIQITATAIPSAHRSKLNIKNRTMTTSILCRNLAI